jgi:acyl-CoA thioesterase
VSTENPNTPGPFSTRLGFRLVERSGDRVVMEATPGPEDVNGGGIVHGGYLSSLLDSTTGWAVHSNLSGGQAAPHTTLTVQYLRAAVPGTPLVCTGRCVKAGRRMAAAEAEITQDGALIARAVTSHTVLSG